MTFSPIIKRIFALETDFPATKDLVYIYSLIITDVINASRRCGDLPLVLGICGPQGSGKSTLTHVLEVALTEGAGLSVATLSLDDLYLSGAERAVLARDVHPLLRTRGVPGTHDVNLGEYLIERLIGAQPGEQLLLPRFDKALDEPYSVERCTWFRGRADIVILEGWCVGAVPEEEKALVDPINVLEQTSDADGRWRTYVNQQLAGRYQSLFAQVDLLLMLRAPGFEDVFNWRLAQERQLAARFEATKGASSNSRIMNDTELAHFIMHYERLTRHILVEMPARADLVVALDVNRRMTAINRLDDAWQPAR